MVFKIKEQVLYFFLLKLSIVFDSTLNCVNKYSKVVKMLLKKSFKLSLEQGLYLMPIFILVPIETDLLNLKIGGK